MATIDNLQSAICNPPRLIAWEVTRTCLLNCRHCRAAARSEPFEGELSTAECFRLLDNIASFAKPIIILTGGEPMLRADIYDIASRAHSLGLPVVMAPCGLLLNDQTVRKIVESGIHRISLSLDGATAKSHDDFRGYAGSFAAVMEGIAAARRGGLDFQINTTVSRHNIGELEAILDLAVKLGASVFNPFLLVPTGRGRALADQELTAGQYEQVLQWLSGQRTRGGIQIRVTCAPHYQRIIRQSGARENGEERREKREEGVPGGCKGTHPSSLFPLPSSSSSSQTPHAANGCLGGKSFAFISHVGKVQICGFMDVECGDVRAADFDLRRIWETSDVFRQLRDVDSYHGRCGVCEFRKVCSGCRARAYAMTGDWLGEEPFCSYEPKGKVQNAE
ncbi:MAG: radical SAM protein [Phycisphaerae bacterium]